MLYAKSMNYPNGHHIAKYMNALVNLRELVLMFYPPRSVVFNYRGCGNTKLSVSGWLANLCVIFTSHK